MLFEYLVWATDQAKELYNETVDVDEMLEHSMAEVNLFSPHTVRSFITEVLLSFGLINPRGTNHRK